MYTMYRSLLVRFVGFASRCEALELAHELTQEEGNTYLRLERVLEGIVSFSDIILKYDIKNGEEVLSRLVGELVLNLSEVAAKLDIDLDDLYVVPMTETTNELPADRDKLEEECSRISKQLVDLAKDMSGDDNSRALDLTTDQRELLLDLVKELIAIVEFSLSAKNIGKLFRSEVAIYISDMISSLDDCTD